MLRMWSIYMNPAPAVLACTMGQTSVRPPPPSLGHAAGTAEAGDQLPGISDTSSLTSEVGPSAVSEIHQLVLDRELVCAERLRRLNPGVGAPLPTVVNRWGLRYVMA
jgi:hypothetical protein